MRKSLLLSIVMVFLLGPWLLTGCGIAQEQYDAVLAGLAKAQQEVQSLEENLEAAQSEVLELTASLGKKEADNLALQDSIRDLEEDVDNLESEVSALEGRIPNLLYETYLNTDVGFSVEYPQGWDKSIDMFMDGQGMVMFLAEDTVTNITIASEYFFSPVTSQELFDITVEQSAEVGLTIVGEENVIVSTKLAKRGISYLEEPEDVMQIIITLVDGDRGWVICCTALAEDFVDYVHTFNEIIDSFNILGTGASA